MDNISKCLKGINMGRLEIEEKLELQYQNKQIIGVNFDKIINSSVINKNDINLELQLPDQQEGDEVSCIRLYVPQLGERMEEEKEEGKEKQEGSEEESEEKMVNQAKKLNQLIVKKANIRNVSGDSIVTISEVPLQVPRGRYTVDIYENFMKFHGSTFNYKIENKHIEKAFLLPKPDDVHMVFVLALKQSVRQGQTNYPFILMQFKKDQMQEVDIKLEESQLSKYDESLQSSYKGPLYDTFTKLFKILVQVNIIIPGTFKSSTGHSAVRCSVKANEGYLFFLQKSLIFINKPISYIKIEEIEYAEFHRTSQSMSKFFDLILKRRGRNISDIHLLGIDKQDKDSILNYFKTRNVKIVTVEEEVMQRNNLEDSEDEDGINQNKQEDDDSHLNEDSEDDESFRADSKADDNSNSADDDFEGDSD